MKLQDVGWDASFDAALADSRERLGPDVVPARVTADFGQDFRVVGEFGDERASLAGRLRYEDARPVVGDFVALSGEPGAWTVVDVLPRRSWLARQAAGKKTGIQFIGANLDVVFVVTSFNEDLSANRLERYLTAIREGGAHPVVVINKVDLVSETERDELLAELQSRLGELDIVTTSAATGEGLDAIRSRLGPGVTGSFVGSSGVGKSSIVNRLIGEELQEVREIREDDAKGRHTTTHRELFQLPGGGVVLDTPGMREFQLWDESLGEAFEDIAELAEQCRFRDCRHEGEPGCAVLEAVESGELDADRLESYRKLEREAEYQALRQDEAQRRARAKDFGRMAKQIMKSKDPK